MDSAFSRHERVHITVPRGSGSTAWTGIVTGHMMREPAVALNAVVTLRRQAGHTMSVRAGTALQHASAHEEASMKRVLRVVPTPAEPRLGYKFVSKSLPVMGGCLACGAEFAKSAGVRRGKAALCASPGSATWNRTLFFSRLGFLSFASFAASFCRLWCPLITSSQPAARRRHNISGQRAAFFAFSCGLPGVVAARSAWT